jgi:hypothetical protein
MYSETSRARTLLDAVGERGSIGAGDDPELKFNSVSRSISLSMLQASLPADVQLIQYAGLKDKLLIWLVTR